MPQGSLTPRAVQVILLVTFLSALLFLCAGP
jgi:hypothetical protein